MLHLLHYLYQDISELSEIENHFNHYDAHMADYYGKKSQLCTLHLHLHLRNQMIKYGALSCASYFARESYIGQAAQWCLEEKFLLAQFIT